MRHIFAFAMLAAAALVAGCTNGVGVTCPPGQTLCGQTCVDTTNDPGNCGACKNACSSDTVCINSACGCPSNQSVCSGKCAATASDVANCGACGNACPEPQVCSSGACAGSCATGQTNCSRSCVDLTSDDNNCGACGTVCTGDQRCMAGVCTPTCPAGQKLCGTTCVNLTNDRANCGACGNACPNDYFCILGECILGCPQPLTRCDPDGGASDGGTQCVDTRWDPNNCGGCGGADVSPSPMPVFPHVCSVVVDDNHDPVCDQGHCGESCKVGLIDCQISSRPTDRLSSNAEPGDICVDPQSDPCNCGGCGIICNGQEECGFFSEGNLQTCCNGTCVDAGTADNSCGTCGANSDCSANSCCGNDASTAFVCLAQTDIQNCGGDCNNCNFDGFDTPACCTNGMPGCVDLAHDNQNCGACNVVCPAPQPSSQPTCCPNPSPAPGDPATVCADTAFDQHNCGNCGTDCTTICPPGEQGCFNGNCQCED